MLKNRKSLVVETLVRVLVLVAVIFLVIIPACNKIKAAILDPEKKYNEAFEKFVEQINEMSGYQETFSVPLKEKSAIIGFSNGAKRWECISCGAGVRVDRPTIVFNKPENSECMDSACICVCNGEFSFEWEAVEGESYKIRVNKCQKGLVCKALKDKGIADKTIIFKSDKVLWMDGSEQYWQNGFLFTTVVGANGLSDYYGLNPVEQEIILHTEKKQNVIGFCNSDMLKYNKDKLKLLEGECINYDWEHKK